MTQSQSNCECILQMKMHQLALSVHPPRLIPYVTMILMIAFATSVLMNFLQLRERGKHYVKRPKFTGLAVMPAANDFIVFVLMSGHRNLEIHISARTATLMFLNELMFLFNVDLV